MGNLLTLFKEIFGRLNLKVTKKDIKEAIELIKNWGATLHVDNDADYSYTYHDPYIDDGEIVVFVGRKGFNRNQFWTRVFHELGHVHCIKNRRYISFHWGYYTKENVIQAEKYVDNLGKYLCKEFKKDIKYIPLKFSKATIKRAYEMYGV